MFGQIYYQKEAHTSYSYGPVVNTIYISTTFYIVVNFYHYLKYRNKIQVEIIIGIFRAIMIVVIGMLIQAVNPTALISGTIQTLVIFTLFLSFENPAEFVDKTTGIFNQYAFFKVISDRVLISKCFYVVVAYIGEGKNDEILRNISTKYEKDTYILSDGCVGIITYDHNTIELFKSNIIEKVNDIEDIFICKFPDEIEDEKSLSEKIKKFGIEARERRIYIDDSTGVRNRNAYENEKEEIPIEFSIGYAYFDVEKDTYVEDMMKRADRHMYNNKRRNHESREQNEKRLY